VAASSDNEEGNKGRLTEDPLVAALVPNPGEGPANAVVLHGFVGKSTRAGHVRLYLDARLEAYAEVSEGDILHHRRLANDAGTFVWVSKSLELKVTRVSSATIQAEFLSGAIAAGRLRPTGHPSASRGVARNAIGRLMGGGFGGGGFGGAGIGNGGFVSFPVNTCGSVIDSLCPSVGCVTWDNCPPPPTVIDWCGPSEFAPLCTI
jgi:hypothetical protein